MKKYQHYVLATLILAALPSLLRLPFWVSIIVVIGAALHFQDRLRKSLAGKLVSAAILCATAVGIWYSFESWFSGDSVLSFFITVVFLKWGESESRRDYLLLIFSSVILATVGALSWDNLLNMLHMMIVVFSLTISLIAIHSDDSTSGSIFLLKKCSTLYILALPLTLLLFLTFPRIPGPLWDLGLAFGLPIKAMMDRGDGQFGKMKAIQPGGIHRASKENENVLIAEFEGAVPFKSQLYWRGPVFWEYDGENWTLPENWDNRNTLLKKAIKTKKRLDRELHFRKNPVRYTLRVMPNGGRWLYGLDVPAAPAPEAFISDEYQLLSIRKIDDHEPKLELLSYLEYKAGVKLTLEQRERGLSLPKAQNPRLIELGKKLQQEHTNSEDILHQAYTLLAGGGFDFEPAHIVEPGDNLLDRYFFDEKKGGAEYLASSVVMLMRAAGVPARLVSGFRGGTIIALTNFVIVKQTDAHVWLEVWLEDSGWNRVEPKDIVLPPEKKIAPLPTAKKDKSSSVKLQKEKSQIIKDQQSENQQKTAPKKVTKAEDKKIWSMTSLSSLFGDMQKWVINYNPDRQMDILKGVGLEDSNWLDLLIGAVAGVTSLLSLYLGVAWWRARKKLDAVSKSWQQFCAKLAKFDLAKSSHECPRNYLQRIRQQKPDLAQAADDIIGRFIDIRYGAEQSRQAESDFNRQVKRFLSMT
jgi:protein-glutamine gamma-glutamyltransferase